MRGKLWAGAAFVAMALAAPAVMAQQIDQPGDNTTTASLPIGQTVEGELNPAGDTDWFRLRVEQGQRYRITMESVAEGDATLDTLLVIYGADGEQIGFNDDAGGTLNSALFYTPSASGEIFVEARGFDPTATGAYRLRVEAAPAPADDYSADQRTRGRLAAGRPVSGTLETEGDVDWFRLSVRAGNVYRISLSGAADSENPVGDPLLRVLDRDGEQLAFNDDHTDLNSYIEFTPAQSGEVFIEARAFADIYVGDYTLSVETGRLPPDNASANRGTRGRIALGGAVEASVEYPGDRDWYRIRLEEGQTYRFSLDASGDTPLGDPFLRIHSPTGEELGSDDDGGGNLNSLLEFTAPTTGTYYIEAAAFADASQGGYTLRARPGDVPGDATTDLTLNAQGDYREGVLSPGGDRDWYRVELTEGQAMRVGLSRVDGADPLGDPYLIIYNAEGQEVARDDDGGGELNSWLEFQAPTAGVYFIEARGFGDDERGRYAVSITAGEIGDNPDTGEPILPGAPRFSTIGQPGDADWFVQELIEGRTYRIHVVGMEGEGGLADPYLRILNPAGQEIASDDDGGTGMNSYLTFTPTAGGPYFFAVSSFGNQGTGRYGILLIDTDVPGHVYTDEALDAADDSRISRIEHPGDLDYYAVELQAGQTYEINVRAEGDNPLTDPYLTIFNGENQRVTADDDSGDGLDARLRFRPTVTGVYFLAASGVGGSTGTYQITIARR